MKYSQLYFSWNSRYKQLKRDTNRKLTRLDFLTNEVVGLHKDDDDLSLLYSDVSLSALEMVYKMDLRILSDSNVKHYFIQDTGLYNFLIRSPIRDVSFIKYLYSKYIGSNILVLHHPVDNHSSIKIAGCVNNPEYSLENRFDYLAIEEKSFLKDNGGLLIIEPKEEPQKVKNGGDYYTRLVTNFLMYINTFPDSVYEGAPDASMPYGLNKSNSKIKVNSDESLIIRNGHTSPHFRRGHFRFLSSDRFKNKKGKSVFVKSTFVNGEAKTVKEAV